jgi:hypothetical protein
MGVTEIVSRTLTLDGICYAFTVYQDGEGFMAFWECDICQNSGHRTGVGLACDSVIRECEKAISNHHTKNHPVGVEEVV